MGECTDRELMKEKRRLMAFGLMQNIAGQKKTLLPAGLLGPLSFSTTE